jgi:hypothetical protein
VTQPVDVRHRITTIGQQDSEVDQHSHITDLLAAIIRAIPTVGARGTEVVNLDTRRGSAR